MNLVGSKDDGPGCSDGDWTAHNAGVTPCFFVDKVKRKELDGTETEIEIEKVTIVVAGDILTECSLPVDDQLRARFVTQYRAWKDGKDISVGTPLSDCPFLTDRQRVYLEANNVFTAEDLAALSDYNIGNVMDGRELRDKATRWLKKRGASDLAAENASLKARLDALEQQVKLKRPARTAAQRAAVSAAQKARHEAAKRGLAALAALSETGQKASETGQSENPVSVDLAVSNESNLPANETVAAPVSVDG